MHNRNFLREKFYVICFVPLVIATKSAVKKHKHMVETRWTNELHFTKLHTFTTRISCLLLFFQLYLSILTCCDWSYQQAR